MFVYCAKARVVLRGLLAYGVRNSKFLALKGTIICKANLQN